MKNLEIILDKYIYMPGEQVTGVVILRNDEPIKVRKVKLNITGLERTSVYVSHGKSGSTYHSYNYILSIEDHIAAGGEFKPGEHRKPISFQIPNNALPSYSGTNTKVNYLIKVRADVPFWFDVKTQRTFWVIYNPEFIKQMIKPVSFTSEHFHQELMVSSSPVLDLLTGNKPRPGFHVELDKETYLAGEVITGRITINNPTQKKIRKVDIILRAKEYANAQGYSRYITVKKYKHQLDMNNIIEGVPSKFSIPIQRGVKTSFEGVYSRCDWLLEFNLDIALAFDEKVKQKIYIYQWH